MRPLNKREKEIIRELVHLKEKYKGDMTRFVREYIFSLSSGSAIYFDIENQNAYLIYPINHKEDDYPEIFDNFYEFLSLLMYLEENRYITIFSTSIRPYGNQFVVLGETFDEMGRTSEYGYIIRNIPEDVNIDRKPTGHKNKIETHSSDELGKSIYNQSCHLFLNNVYVSEGLKQLVKRKFRTEEEIRSFNQFLWHGLEYLLHFL